MYRLAVFLGVVACALAGPVPAPHADLMHFTCKDGDTLFGCLFAFQSMVDKMMGEMASPGGATSGGLPSEPGTEVDNDDEELPTGDNGEGLFVPLGEHSGDDDGSGESGDGDGEGSNVSLDTTDHSSAGEGNSENHGQGRQPGQGRPGQGRPGQGRPGQGRPGRGQHRHQ